MFSKCCHCKTLCSKLNQKSRKLQSHKDIIRNLKGQIKTMKAKISELEQKMSQYNLLGNMKLAISQLYTQASQSHRKEIDMTKSGLLIAYC